MSPSANQQPGPGRRRWRDLSEAQQQVRVFGYAFLATVVLVGVVLMIFAWGFYGMLWRLGVTAAIGGILWLAWKRRRQLAAAAKTYAQQAAARRAEAAAAAAAQAQAAAERQRQAVYAGASRRQEAPAVQSSVVLHNYPNV